MQRKQRSGYIDIVKFISAVIIAEFHLQTGIFPGGRIAVEIFFMISAYLMMKYIERNSYPEDNLGQSTLRFIVHKYKSLLPYLLPSVLLGYVVYAFVEDRTINEFFIRFPRLLFEILPLRTAGLHGIHVLGISWYLSAMFIALAILYPLCKKFKSNFTLLICPLLFAFIYGFLSEKYGNIAVTTHFQDSALISTGIYRGLAASAAGCMIYEVCNKLSLYQPTRIGRIIFTLLEISGFAYLFYAMHSHSRSQYDFVLVFLVFGLLIIGISGLSATSLFLKEKWTKPFGILSTLIVLNHYCWYRYLPKVLGEGYEFTNKVWYYVLAVLGSSVIVYFSSKLLTLLGSKFSHKTLLIKK